jgi:signal transduction histidine kinase/ligand-binding sensor domain-containing protein
LRTAVAVLLFAHAAAAQYRVDSWTADSGLPINSVNRVQQTRDGFLWLATFAGLVRYDGATFRTFNTVNSPVLVSSRFVNLFEDRERNLWAPTEREGLIRYRDGAFTSYTTANGLPDNAAHTLFYDTEGHLLIDTAKGLVEWRNGAFVRSHPTMPSTSDPTKAILSYTETGAVWYSEGPELHKYEHERVSVTLRPPFPIKRASEDRTGRLWMEVVDGPRRKLASYSSGQYTLYSDADGVLPFRTMSFGEDRQGNVWLGMRSSGGLLRVQDGRIRRFSTADALASNDVGSVFQDREGSLWVPTDGGLSQLTTQVVEAHGKDHGLAADNTYAILQDHEGAIWIGSWAGLTKFENGVFTDRSQEFGVAAENVLSLLEDRSGGLWIGMWGGGIKRMKDGKLENFPRSAPPGTVVRTMLQDRAGDIWTGGADGLHRYRDGAFSRIPLPGGASSEEVLSLYEDRAGSLWIGTEGGVSRYRDGQFTRFGAKDGFPGKMVRAIHEDASGTIWIGTYDSGLFRYRDGRFTRFTSQQGLLDNAAFRILEDRRGNFWLSCNLGIYRVSRKELDDVAEGRATTVTSVPYGRRDGMLTAECNGGGQPAGIQARDGRLWFPTQKGVAIIDPDSITSNSQPPPVVIDEVLVDRAAVALNGRIDVLPGQSDLEIHYAGLTFVRPELSRFKYRMEGIDGAWVEAGNRRTAYYSHLAFGSYRFQVIAANRDGVWNAEGATVDVRVKPPYWRTLWFQMLIALSIAATAGLMVHRRIRKLKQEHAIQEAFSRRLIASQEGERSRIAAGLHDSLGQTLAIIKNRALVSLDGGRDPQRAFDHLEEIAAAATDALGDVRDIVHDLRPIEIDRLGLTKALSAMVNKVAESTSIHIEGEIDGLEGAISGDAEIHLYRIVQEGLNNIVKHSVAEHAWVRVRRSTDDVEITVGDDGKGFSPDAAPATARKGSGLGLMSVSERARILGGTVQVQSAPGSGTIVTIRIALRKGSDGF